MAANFRGACAMNDNDIDTTVAPVPDSLTEDLYRRVVPLQAQQARSWRRAAKWSRWMAGAFCAVALAEAMAITALLPTEKVMPVFVYLDKFNVAQSTNVLSELPADHRIAGIDALLWQYLEDRASTTLRARPTRATTSSAR
jgi:type IV secretory pathway component VirB8